MRKYYFCILFCSILSAELIKPENNSTISYTHVLFEWDQVVDASEYEIQISNSDNFDDIILSSTESSLIYIDSSHLNWENQYHWRVRPIYSLGDAGPWIGENSFTVLSTVTDPTITLYDSDSYQDGITFLGSLDGNFSAAFDKGGNEIWNTQDNDIIMYNTNLRGELYGCYYNSELENSYPGVELDVNSNYIWEEPNDEFVHHDLLRLPDGNYISIAESIQGGPIPPTGPWFEACCAMMGGQCNNCYSNFFPWVGDKIVIWDRDTKESIWEWDAFDYFSTEDYDGVYYYDGVYGGSWDNAFTLNRYDWTHINAISYSVEQSAIYISCRHLSRITKIYFNFDNYNDPDNGEIIWNLGQQMPSGEVDCGDDLNFSWQHSISVLDNGNIVTLDNGNLSNDFNTGLDNPISRAIEINLNESEDGCAAEIVWEYSLEEDLFGHASGGVQKLENGNYLISTVGDGGTTLEVSDEMEVVWEAKYNLFTGLIHRAYRVPGLYPVEVSATASGYTIINSAHYEGESGIYVPLLDSVRVNFTLYNNGSIDEEFIYLFESLDSDIWYPYSEGSVMINAGGSTVLNIAGQFTASDEGGPYDNNVELTIQSINNHNISKTYNFTVYGTFDDLSNDQTINEFNIMSAYPNPFNPSATINLNINQIINNAEIQVYDVNGKLVDKLYSGNLTPGNYSFIWNPDNISSGEYFIRFKSKYFTRVKKIVYVK